MSGLGSRCWAGHPFWREQKGNFVDRWSQFVVVVKPGGLEFEFESVSSIFFKALEHSGYQYKVTSFFIVTLMGLL